MDEGDSFMTEIMSKGKVLYEEVDDGVGEEGRKRPRRSQTNQSK
jgi:hypothetical protein